MTAQIAKSRLKALSPEYVTILETMACWNDDDNDNIDVNPRSISDNSNSNNSSSNSTIAKLKSYLIK